MLDEKDLQAIQAMMETEFQPKFDLLAENQQLILQKLVPRSRVDDLEDDIKLLKFMVRQMSERISDLEKAN